MSGVMFRADSDCNIFSVQSSLSTFAGVGPKAETQNGKNTHLVGCGVTAVVAVMIPVVSSCELTHMFVHCLNIVAKTRMHGSLPQRAGRFYPRQKTFEGRRQLWLHENYPMHASKCGCFRAA